MRVGDGGTVTATTRVTSGGPGRSSVDDADATSKTLLQRQPPSALRHTTRPSLAKSRDGT